MRFDALTEDEEVYHKTNPKVHRALHCHIQLNKPCLANK